MDVFSALERLMSMDDETWARHANPWSVYTRFTCLPLLALAVWSRTWIGGWSLLAVGLALLWTWYNPRAFPPPRRTDGWASQGTLGERMFLDRKRVPIPAHHERMALLLGALSAPGAVILIYGLAVLDVWATICGLVATVLPKVWFVDRMVWLYRDMRGGRDGER